MSAGQVTDQSQGRWIVAAVALAVVAATLGVFWFRVQSNPEIPLLVGKSGAEWIRYDQEFFYSAIHSNVISHGFRKKFQTTSQIAPAMLNVRGMRAFEVHLDGKLIHVDDGTSGNWKVEDEILIPFLQPGNHELGFVVSNIHGPPMLLAWSDDLDLRSGGDWEASIDNKTWSPVAIATESDPTTLSREFPSSFEGLYKTWPVALCVGLVSIGVWLVRRAQTSSAPVKGSKGKGAKSPATPVQNDWTPDRALFAFKISLMVLWLALSFNDRAKIPLGLGLDADYHEQYVQIIVDEHKLPYATEGWQLFQSPLFYMLGAVVWGFAQNVLGASVDTCAGWLRIIPIFCGLAQIELCYRAARYLYPSRQDLQAVGMLVGGLMPMNLYMSQTTSNEPLSSCLTAAFVVLIVKAFREPAAARTWTWQILAGGTLGLAILAKVSPVLLIPSAVVAAVVALRRGGAPLGETLRGVGVATAMAALGCGWWFVRNMLKFGKPWMNGWDPARGVAWWQLPGYRTLHDFTTFGEALSHPIYAAQSGFWDAMYSTMWADGYVGGMTLFEVCPPWNYSFVAATALLSLLPMAAILLGVWKTLRAQETTERLILWFALTSIGLYLAAMLWLYLKLPIYSTAKASYTLGLLPCYAILASAGFEILTRKKWLQPVVFTGLAVWAVYSYAGYCVLREPPDFKLPPVTGKNPPVHATLESGGSAASTTSPAGNP